LYIEASISIDFKELGMIGVGSTRASDTAIETQSRRPTVMLFNRLINMPFLVFYATNVPAVELSIGGVYQAGTTVQSSEAGLSLTIPSGWQGAMPQGVNAFVIQKLGAQDTILVQAEQMDKQSVMALMNQPITLDQGMTLMPLGKNTEKSDVITGIYSVSGQYANAKGEIKAVVGKYGISVAFIGLGFSAGEPEKTLAKLAKTVRFEAPKQAQQNQPGVASGGEVARVGLITCVADISLITTRVPAIMKRTTFGCAMTEVIIARIPVADSAAAPAVPSAEMPLANGV
jgi:hypothetical protein